MRVVITNPTLLLANQDYKKATHLAGPSYFNPMPLWGSGDGGDGIEPSTKLSL